MRVLVTSAASRIGRWLADGLSAAHEVRRTDLPGRAGADAVSCDLGHDEATDELVAGLDAIVHVGYAGQQGDDVERIDYHTRRTYNLLYAAAEAGLRRLVYISTLRLLEPYEENLTVTERWRPQPVAHDTDLLACHLGEITAKEFARDRRLDVVALRLGFPIVEGPLPENESATVAVVDAVHAVDRALAAPIEAWQPVHLQSPVPAARFLMRTAAGLGLLREGGAS